MTDELKMIEKNKTWELVNRPTYKPIIGVKTKLNLDGSIQKNKTRFHIATSFPWNGSNTTSSSIFVHQKKYASTLLNKFGLTNCNPVLTPLVTNEKLSKEDGNGATDEEMYRKVVGSLLYLTATRPDIMFTASLLARFMHCPTKKHLGTAKRVLRYVKSTLDYGIEYIKGKQIVLVGYFDSDWSGFMDDMKSTSGYAFSFGSGVFSWASVKQNCVALSTAEAEYISASEATA
ncbi:secreted RxLR effector protein 161-like [Ziziphus jujuba]|uniref:Secreted RxLR effector protein 161-like n=1 Tax=Ziziphus jujuba TaxID=326968 RepID=A0ABM4AGM3_ZIZJJ|nr:secreted RxLR effector protein 161-like [Ziziphus jujuba]